MVKLKKIHLENYCGYINSIFDFSEENSVKPISVFFSPNGSGKSNLLDAIELLGNARRFRNVDTSVIFRKLTYHEDYDPSYAEFKKSENPMILTGDFVTDDGIKQVIMSSKGNLIADGVENGIIKNELPEKYNGHVYVINADNPMESNRFQLSFEKAKDFLQMAEAIYGFRCGLEKIVSPKVKGSIESTVNSWINEPQEKIEDGFYTDFVIYKKRSKVHYRSMSDGEKKIATLLRNLFDPSRIDDVDIICIDNMEKEVYKDRHYLMYDELLKNFPTKQFLVTTHSAVLVGFRVKDNYVPGYVPEKYLYDIEKFQEGEQLNVPSATN